MPSAMAAIMEHFLCSTGGKAAFTEMKLLQVPDGGRFGHHAYR